MDFVGICKLYRCNKLYVPSKDLVLIVKENEMLNKKKTNDKRENPFLKESLVVCHDVSDFVKFKIECLLAFKELLLFWNVIVFVSRFNWI